MPRLAEHLQGRAELRRVVRVVRRHRRHDQRVAAEQVAHERRLLGRLHLLDPQGRVHLGHAVDRDDREPADLLELLVEQVRLEQRVDLALAAQVDRRRDGPDLAALAGQRA